MQKKKENFLDKVIKKNFNNELEHVLENKAFDENTKNILLSILYKLETAYSDYEQVKKNVMPKDDFLQMIIDIIEKDIDTINLVKMESEEAKILGNKTFLVDKENKQITCYPIERKLLYAIAKIDKQDKIIKDKYSVIDRTISDLINTGNNINMVEPMRDFNGFSWSVISKDIESIEHNLIYQNLRILIGQEFLNKWVHNREFIIDYYESFCNKLEDLFGKKNEQELIDSISKLSVMLEAKYNKDKIQDLIDNKVEIQAKLEEISDKEGLIKNLTKDKKDINKKIKYFDTIISDKALLQEEYVKRNEILPLDKKIFSMKVLAKMLKEERQVLVEKRQQINKMLNPQKFVKYSKELEEQYKFIQYIDNNNIEEQIQQELINFQKTFLNCLKIKVEKAKTKEDILDLLTEFRYYINIPINKQDIIVQQEQLEKELIEVIQMLINKAVKEKTLVAISNNQKINCAVLKQVLNNKIIGLENINIELVKQDENVYLQIYDEEVFDTRINLGKLSAIDLNSLIIKFNKKIKVFTS